MEEEDDSFVMVGNAKTMGGLVEEEISKVRKGNSDINKQLQRDIDMLGRAVVCYGSSESNKVKARTLLKSILLLYFGNISYRDKCDKNKFHAWSELTAYCALPSFPIAAALLHGSRVLIEFPSEIGAQLHDWLIMDKESWRYAATHGINELVCGEKIENGVTKYLEEKKVDVVSAAYHAVANLVNPFVHLGGFFNGVRVVAQHYGTDLALGGVGNTHFFSGKTIRNNGKHGHLYHHIRYPKAKGKAGGLLLGIEQSGPLKMDQFEQVHNLDGPKAYTASGGDFICKPPENKGLGDAYIGLSELPIASYYDSLWNRISKETFILIQNAYIKSNALLDFLPSEEEKLNFINEMISSSGKINKEIFEQLFEKYLKKIPQVRPCSIEKTARFKLNGLKELAVHFMENVTQNMGFFSRNSHKKTIFSQLINKLTKTDPCKATVLRTLKLFISVALMNRYHQKNGKTHSGKACLNLLNTDYALFKDYFFYESKTPFWTYKDLSSALEIGNKKAFALEREEKLSERALS
jgi:hypothetical protein